MKRFFKQITLAALAFSLVSCGLPGAAVRTVSNTTKSVANMAKNLGGSAVNATTGL